MALTCTLLPIRPMTWGPLQWRPFALAGWYQYRTLEDFNEWVSRPPISIHKVYLCGFEYKIVKRTKPGGERLQSARINVGQRLNLSLGE